MSRRLFTTEGLNCVMNTAEDNGCTVIQSADDANS
jgi:hypothetical protein